MFLFIFYIQFKKYVIYIYVYICIDIYILNIIITIEYYYYYYEINRARKNNLCFYIGISFIGNEIVSRNLSGRVILWIALV